MRAFELLKLATGFKPKLLDQPTPRDAIALKRVGLAPRSVQREHQLANEPLARRMLANQRLELSRQPRVLSECELRVDPLLHRGQPRLLQPRDLGLRERLVLKIRKRRATPQP